MLVVPSRIATDGDCEGLPTVVLESLRAGLPVIATNHAGIPEIIKDGETGLLVSENDPDALANALQVALKTGDHMLHMTTNGQKRVRRDFNARTQSLILKRYLLEKTTLIAEC